MNDGRSIPQIGLGTWRMDDAEAASVVQAALEIGYRHIDTAVLYENEAGVGEGIRRSRVARSDVFVTTKVPRHHQGYERAKTSLRESLSRLGLDYVDLYLIHWPNPDDDNYVETWSALVELQKAGLALSIGVSNFKPAHLDRLASAVGVVPAVNQIQLYPAVSQVEARAYHSERGILTESWGPLGRDPESRWSAPLLQDPVVLELACRHDKTPAQIVLRWHVQFGLVVLPKSSSPSRLAENIDVFSFSLSVEDMDRISALDDGSVSPVDSDEVHEG